MKTTPDIQVWPIEKLKEWANNPREITQTAYDRLKKQIFTLDVYKPLLVHTDGTVLGGNMRLRAFREYGIKEVTVSIVNAETEEKKIEYALSDNDQAGRTDKEKMLSLIEQYPTLELGDYAIHLDEPQTLQGFMDQFKEPIEDDVPDISKDPPISKLGEVYQLGRHRLMCGDATKIEDVEKLMNGQKADMVFTDPPYGVNIGDKSGREIIGDSSIEEMGKITKDAFVNISLVIKDGAVYYVCSPQGGDMELMMMMMRDAGIKCRHQIIWKKDQAVFSMGRLDYDYIHEPILYGWKNNHNFYSKNEVSVWDIPRPRNSKLHPTMKPITLVSKAIKNSSKEGDIVLDLFGGSGSTLIACEQTNRTCYMMEIDPSYCDIIRKRYAKFINKEDTWIQETPTLS